jgi:uncharacterized oligopeptide transporter (OPT) family protein
MSAPLGGRRNLPFVPESMKMREFTWRAMLLGLVMCVVLGAANAYLGLRAGQTIAATYPAAVIGMAVLRVFKGSILEENIARTAGSIGESVAAGAVFTLPAFFIAHVWAPPVIPKGLGFWASMWALAVDPAYAKSTSLMMVGAVLGVLFVSLIRRVMVEDPELPFPESVAASEIHKAGQAGSRAAKYLFYNIGFGAAVYLAGVFNLFAPDRDFFFRVGQLGTSTLRLGPIGSTQVLTAGGVSSCAAPTVSPAFIGVGYIIGPELAALNFSGSVVAWGLLIPLLIFFMGPQLRTYLPAGARDEDWLALANAGGGGQHDGGHVLHAFQNAQEPDCRVGQGLRGAEGRRAGAGIREPDGTLHEFQNRVRADRLHLPGDVHSVYLSFGPGQRRHCGRAGDADCGLLLRHGFRVPGGGDRVVQ